MSPRSHSRGALNAVLYLSFPLLVPHANLSIITNEKNLNTAIILGGGGQL